MENRDKEIIQRMRSMCVPVSQTIMDINTLRTKDRLATEHMDRSRGTQRNSGGQNMYRRSIPTNGYQMYFDSKMSGGNTIGTIGISSIGDIGYDGFSLGDMFSMFDDSRYASEYTDYRSPTTTDLLRRLFELYLHVNPTGSMEDVPTPLDKKQLNSLQKSKYREITKEMVGTNEIATACSICQSDFEQDESVTILPCQGKHQFHTACIDEWLSKFSKKCPNCKEDLEETLKTQHEN